MTDRERRLRHRIDTLTDERDHAQSEVSRLTHVGRQRRCVYCGAWTKYIACGPHADLLRLDPHMDGKRLRTAA